MRAYRGTTRSGLHSSQRRHRARRHRRVIESSEDERLDRNADSTAYLDSERPGAAVVMGRPQHRETRRQPIPSRGRHPSGYPLGVGKDGLEQ